MDAYFIFLFSLYMILCTYPFFSKGWDMFFNDLIYVLKETIIMLAVMLATLIKKIKCLIMNLKSRKKSVGNN